MTWWILLYSYTQGIFINAILTLPFSNTPGQKYMLQRKKIIVRHPYDDGLLDSKSFFFGKMT